MSATDLDSDSAWDAAVRQVAAAKARWEVALAGLLEAARAARMAATPEDRARCTSAGAAADAAEVAAWEAYLTAYERAMSLRPGSS